MQAVSNEDIAILKRALSLFDRGDEEEDELREMIPKFYIVHDYESQGDRSVGTIDCGSIRCDDTPVALYRALFLFRPDVIRAREMYKGPFLTLVSPDQALVASFEFYKYEIGIYFGASPGYVQGRGSGVISGMPGSDNGFSYAGEYPEAWFGLLQAVMSHTWMVYGGNNFEV